MSLRGIQPGALITRVYYAIPEHATIGETFESWDDAVTRAQARRHTLLASLTESLAGFSTPEQIAATADAQVRVDLRWVIRQPDGTEVDMVVQRFADVSRLRTWAQAGG